MVFKLVPNGVLLDLVGNHGQEQIESYNDATTPDKRVSGRTVEPGEKMKKLMIAASILFMAISAYANDSAVEVSVGGLKLRKEHSVLMEKERLFISKELVRVEYEFRNTTNVPIISEVAFPLPGIEYDFPDYQGGRYFDDFKAWIDDKPIKIEKEVRAYVKGREVTDDLQKAGISIEGFGGFVPGQDDSQIMLLDPNIRNELVSIGALKAPDNKDNHRDYSPEWELEIKFHWQQEFPPGAVVHIKHEYPPVSGYSPVQIQNYKKEFKNSCIKTNTFNEAKKRVKRKMAENPGNNNYFGVGWVSYILTTANTWQTPIKDFEMIVQKEKDEMISFCWSGPVEKIGETQFRARKTNFIPVKDLKIYFLGNF
jgi:hypothetical protein